MITSIVELEQYFDDTCKSTEGVADYIYGDTGYELMQRLNAHVENNYEGPFAVFEIAQTKLNATRLDAVPQRWYCAINVLGKYDPSEQKDVLAQREFLNRILLKILGRFVEDWEESHTEEANTNNEIELSDEVFPLVRVLNADLIGWRFEFDYIEYVNNLMFTHA